MKFTPEKISKLPSDSVFVFGSNTHGYHCGGAAFTASVHFGAVLGQSEGAQGRSYAIPTIIFKPNRACKVPVDDLKKYLLRFFEYVKSKSNLVFYMTKIGCGIAGWKVDEIMSVIVDVIVQNNITPLPTNIVWPKEFYEILKSNGLVD